MTTSKNATLLYEVQNISKSYGSVVALSDVSLKIHAGEVIGLVGDNGAGKSSLVKVLSCAHLPSEGKVLLEGVERSWSSPRAALEAGVETLYQDSGLAPHLSVSANVFLGRERYVKGILGKLGFLAKKEMDQVAHENLERVGIAVPQSNRWSHSSQADSAKRLQSAALFRGRARSSFLMSQQTTLAPVRLAKFLKLSRRQRHVGWALSSSLTPCRMSYK